MGDGVGRLSPEHTGRRGWCRFAGAGERAGGAGRHCPAGLVGPSRFGPSRVEGSRELSNAPRDGRGESPGTATSTRRSSGEGRSGHEGERRGGCGRCPAFPGDATFADRGGADGQFGQVAQHGQVDDCGESAAGNCAAGDCGTKDGATGHGATEETAPARSVRGLELSRGVVGLVSN